MRQSFLLISLVLLVGLGGCMSLQSKQAAESQMGHPYSGVTGDALAVKCMWEMPAVAKKEDGTSYALTIPFAALATVLFAVDSVLSAVVDTLFLPIDLAVKPKHDRWTLDKPCRKGLSA